MKGHIRKRGNNYCIIIDIDPDPEAGKRRQKWFSGYKTKKEAEKDVAKKITELNEGIFVEPSKLTLKDYLVQWLEIKRMSLERNSYVSYYNNVTHHVIPSIGMIALHKLNVMDIQKCYKSALDTGISNNSLIQLHRVLKTALNLAVKQNIISRNPAQFVELPKKRKKPHPDLDGGRSKKISITFTRLTISHCLLISNYYRDASWRSFRFTLAGC
ncbi:MULTISPECIES: Arm DNA-binding domain-containing protein [Bacillus]|uniref:Arm DNA-binding domain-containing protein n=1 Tax=Bacillus TaxID=1386 RepID=UPI00269EBDD4